jgi:glycosyltransferase involved in cell wall biosynthesis
MRLLLVSHHFPPMGGAGVQRALKFARYLGDFGVAVTVLAGDDPDYLQDASLLSELPPAVAVHRVPHRTLLQRTMALRRGGTAGPAAPAAPARASVAPASPSAPGVRWRDAVLAGWAALQWPDERGGWARAAEAVGQRLLRERGHDVVMSTSPPVAAHALACRLARRAGLPWVADWRDLWTDNPSYARPAWRWALDQRLERRWHERADGIVTVTPSWQRLLRARAPAATPVAFVPNGYDEADFASAPEPASADGCWRLVHVGTLYAHQTPLPLLEAAERMLAAEPGLQARLRLRLVGAVGSRFAPALSAFEARWPGVIEATGAVGHAEAVAEMQRADALLLLVGGGAAARGVLPGKLFEYLRAGRPMLVVGEADGDAAQLAQGHGHARVAAESDPGAIAAAMRQMMATDGPTARMTDGARFERRALAGELAAFLRDVRQRFDARAHG